MKRDGERLKDMLEAIERIERYVPRGRDVFERDELVQTWMVHNLQIVGEAARQLSEDLRRRHPDVPWALMIGMRNILVHHYQEIDTEVVWATIEHGVPELKERTVLEQAEQLCADWAA